MAVASWDRNFSYKQDAFARLGEKAHRQTKMSPDEVIAFQRSGFMQTVDKINHRAKQLSDARDKLRADTDPSFKLSSPDVISQSPPQFDKYTNYYRMLGANEYASQADIKKAYKDLSLVYHPDKTAGLSPKERKNYGQIFIELKRAYLTLSDNAARRQYDMARDRELATSEFRGTKLQERSICFNPKSAQAVGTKQKANTTKALPSSKTVEVSVQARLEKFAFGGRKAVTRSLRVKDPESADLGLLEFEDQDRDFQLEIPQGAPEPMAVDFKEQGDEHEDAPPDSLRFLVSAKPHEVVDRHGQDLSVRERVPAASAGPCVAAETPSVRGRHVLLWGPDPFSGISEMGTRLILVRMVGEGLTPQGALSCTLRLDGCEPQSGARAASPVQLRGAAVPSALLRRAERRQQATVKVESVLVPRGGPVALLTEPPCSLQAYAGTVGSSCSSMATVESPGLFAIRLASEACSSGKAAGEWQRLKAGILPLLWATGFKLFGAARAVLPKPLAWSPASAEDPSLEEAQERESTRRRGRPRTSWRERGNAAFAREEYWTALGLYSEGLEDVPEEEQEERARLLSNRSACFLKLKECGPSLSDARKAVELRPDWPRAWSRVACAAAELGADVELREALRAHLMIVELDPSSDNADALHAFIRKHMQPNEGEARQAKIQGMAAFREKRWNRAVALFTNAIARLDPQGRAVESLRGDLLGNRSAAFAQVGSWPAAAEDAKRAIEVRPASAKVHCRLGVALLGLRRCEHAYAAFAQALQKDHTSKAAKRGRDMCLTEMVLGRSLSTEDRHARCLDDAGRPSTSTRVFAISDIHLDHGKSQWEWVHQIDGQCFREDVLIIAGNLATSMSSITAGLSKLKAKFRRVFYTVGADEMRISAQDSSDSFTKLHAILAACDHLGVDVCPAAVSDGLCIAPLLSWYNSDFDWTDPRPDPHLALDSMCRWPMDAHRQVWKYMHALNRQHVEEAAPWRQARRGAVITFSHFLPRRDLPFHTQTDIGMSMAKFQGCEAIDEQARRASSQLHVYGRSHIPHACVHDGVMYVNQPLGYPQERLLLHPNEDAALLMQVHDGRSLCMIQWDSISDQAHEQPDSIW